MNDFSVTIGIWVVSGDGPPSLPPEQRPIGRAALALRKDGIQVVFGDKMVNGCMDGYTAIEGGWTRQSGLQVNAVHDRFPSQMRADQYQDLIDGLHGCPLGNSRDFTLLCRDKIDSQQALVQQGIQMPPIETNPDQFADRLKAWGSAFIKPRFGALGTGVARVRPGDPLPRTRPGMIPGTDEPAILQCAVPPPSGLAGMAVRVLVQRTADGWHIEAPVVRSSQTDPVANAARGATVAPGTDALSSHLCDRINSTARQITDALDQLPRASRAVEAGLDMVIDDQEHPHLIEINSRPRGRLEVLATLDPDRFGSAHEIACGRPIQMLAHWCQSA